MPLVPLDNVIQRPDNYRSNFTDSDKNHAIAVAVDHVTRSLSGDQTIMVATLIGSSLVGTDTPNSDFDVKVSVANLRKAREFTMNAGDKGLATEMGVAVLDNDTMLKRTSHIVVYSALNSVFTRVNPHYKEFFDSIRINRYRLQSDMSSMVTKTLWKDKPLEKQWRQLLQYYSCFHNKLYVDPNMVDRRDPKVTQQVLDWAEESVLHKQSDPDAKNYHKTYGPLCCERVNTMREAFL